MSKQRKKKARWDIFGGVEVLCVNDVSWAGCVGGAVGIVNSLCIHCALWCIVHFPDLDVVRVVSRTVNRSLSLSFPQRLLRGLGDGMVGWDDVVGFGVWDLRRVEGRSG
jgi:hypothetical protein